jgi:hypothetical protein
MKSPTLISKSKTKEKTCQLLDLAVPVVLCFFMGCWWLASEIMEVVFNFQILCYSYSCEYSVVWQNLKAIDRKGDRRISVV